MSADVGLSNLRNGGIEPCPGTGSLASPDPTSAATPRSGVVIGRYQATVVVTVHGELDPALAAHLGHVLADLIDGQGNLSLVVDLHDARAADARPLSALADAEELVRRHGGTMTLARPPAPLHRALGELGLGHLVSVALDDGSDCAPASDRMATGREWRAHPAGRSPFGPSGSSQR